MTSVAVNRISRDEAKRERAELLASTGMTEAKLRAGGREWRLDADQLAALDRINGLDWLMTGVSDQCCPCAVWTCTDHDGHDGDHTPREKWWTR